MWQLKLQARWNKAPEFLELKDAKEILDAYPKIDTKFINDLKNYAKTASNYVIESAIMELRTPKGLSVQPDNWLLVLGTDADNRPYQILIEKEKAGYMISAFGPLDFVNFVTETGKSAIGPILALLASPKKMRILLVYVSYQTKPAWKPEELPTTKNPFLHWVQDQKALPNVNGQWFPAFAPLCPVCNNPLVGLEQYQVGFGQLTCPRCGYKKNK
ncbi:MAG: hypothetical protein RBG13Loki_0629 [Promethearchaeota archaeon CR_4]|nr:MAG: hypothetical protein RBG13Loki_0629 [Candidatus Lokiarchaeota archaeon CR_4]